MPTDNATITGNSHIATQVVLHVEVKYDEYDVNVDEFILMVNGHVVKRLSRFQAERMAIIDKV